MIDFMVIAAPRSGTTWAANWLSTDTTICVHDPLLRVPRERLDEFSSPGKTLGIACTALYQFPEFVNAHPARKVIVHRDIREINDSLEELGVNPLEEDKVTTLLDSIAGVHVTTADLFNVDAAQHIYEYLLEKPFDPERHYELVKMQIQPEFACVPYNKAVIRNLFAELYRD